MHIKSRLTVYNDKQPHSLGFGQGIMVLLDEIEKAGSIKQAAAAMEMAYSKAWKLLTTTEREFDVVLLERKGHRGSTLTPEGRDLLRAYKKTKEAMERAAQEAFERYF